MESQKLISIDMDKLASSNIALSDSSTPAVINSKNRSSIFDEKKFVITDLTNYSETFRNLLALYDESVQLSPLMVAEMCAKLNITEPHKVQIYVHKARNRENFLLYLFGQCSNEIKYLDSVIEFLDQFESTSFIVQSLCKERDSIFRECEKNKKSAFSFKFSLQGNKISFKSNSQSSLSTNSSNDSEKILKTNVLLVYTSNQQRKYSHRIKRFKDHTEKSNIALKEFYLGKKYESGIKNELKKWENWSIFLLFDKEIDDLIDFNKKTEMRQSYEINNIIEVYYQLYWEFLNKGNRRFYLFMLDDYKEYCVHKNGKFRYHWLLTKIADSNGQEKFIPPIKIPEYEKPNPDSANLEKFLQYIKAILPLGHLSVL